MIIVDIINLKITRSYKYAKFLKFSTLIGIEIKKIQNVKVI